jgi:hypothetical protein
MPPIHTSADRSGADLDSPPPSGPGRPVRPPGLLQGLAGGGPAPSFQSGGGLGAAGGSPQTLVLSELMQVESGLRKIATVLPGTMAAIGPMIDALRQAIPRALADSSAPQLSPPLSAPPAPGMGVIPPPAPSGPLPSMGPQLGQAMGLVPG